MVMVMVSVTMIGLARLKVMAMVGMTMVVMAMVGMTMVVMAMMGYRWEQ